MTRHTAIGWTDHTFNPWWGCTRVSPGCQHCYAETFAKRTGNAVWGKEAPRRFFGDKHWAEPLRWNAEAERSGRPALVFCASMADVFEDRPDLGGERERLWGLVASTPSLIWQLLTKRPENVLRLVPVAWTEWADAFGERHEPRWPANVWMGTTVEDQQRAEERIPRLLEIPAPVRFLSCEPLLGHVDLNPPGWLVPPAIVCGPVDRTKPEVRTAIAQVLRAAGDDPVDVAAAHPFAGGESGPGHRPLDVDHARAIRDQCVAAGVPFFFKQVGGRTPTAGGHELDARTIQQFPAAAGR